MKMNPLNGGLKKNGSYWPHSDPLMSEIPHTRRSTHELHLLFSSSLAFLLPDSCGFYTAPLLSPCNIPAATNGKEQPKKPLHYLTFNWQGLAVAATILSLVWHCNWCPKAVNKIYKAKLSSNSTSGIKLGCQWRKTCLIRYFHYVNITPASPF